MVKHRNIVDIVQHRAATQEARPLYTWLDDDGQEVENWTVADLNSRAIAIAQQLLSMAKSGDRALLIYPPGLEFMAAFFGCLYAKIYAVPVNMPRRRREDGRVRAIARDCRPTTLLTTSSVLAQKASLVRKNPELDSIPWLATNEAFSGMVQEWQQPPIDADDIAFLQYTSGSTAVSKGVIVTHKNIVSVLETVISNYGMVSDSVYVIWLPLFHDLGLMSTISAAGIPGCHLILLAPMTFLQKPIRWLEAMSRYKCTFTAAPNFSFDLCVLKTNEEERKGLDLSSLKGMLSGGEPVRAETLQRFSATFAGAGIRLQMFAPTYGLAETIVYVTGAGHHDLPLIYYFSARELRKGQAVPVLPESDGAWALTRSGKAGEEMGVRIVDPENSRLKEDGQVGEIWVTGPHVCRGYFNRAELTQLTFQAHIAGADDKPYLRTGDLGFIHEGQLFISGRLKEMIIIRGNNYFPQDIEHTVEMSHPALQMAGGAAFGIDSGREELLVVAHEVKRAARHNLDLAQIVGPVRRAIAREHGLSLDGLILVRPHGVPKTTSGKTRRLETRIAFQEGSLPVLDQWLSQRLLGDEEETPAVDMTGYPPFQLAPDRVGNFSQIEGWIRQRILAIPGLGQEPLDLARPFVDYGLDSLLSVQLVNELAAWVGHSLALSLLWELPNIEALIDHLVETLLSEAGQESSAGQGPRQIGPQEAERLLDRIDDLGEDEIDSLLADLD